MSTERTFYEDDNVDLFINEDLLDGEITIYSNYLMNDSAVIKITPQAIAAMYHHIVGHVLTRLDKSEGVG